jgi:hypothetical protein
MPRKPKSNSAKAQRLANILGLRNYQGTIFTSDHIGIIVLHWSRQIGKSYALAAWAVWRLFEYPGRLVTVLSNSRDNGAEFVLKCTDLCNRIGQAFELDLTAPNVPFELTRMEVRIRRQKKIGRIKVLAANPRTARGFSGDLILDEFAFHEDSAAIWEAAEPILASNPDFRCRIASTGNGKHNMFYRMASGWRPSAFGVPPSGGSEPAKAGTPNNCGEIFTSAAGFAVSRVTRTAAYQQGVKIYDLKNKREPITPEAARAQAMDKTAYDQNYECAFADENMTLLTYEIISAAQSDIVSIDAQEWSQASIARMNAA